MPVDLTPYWTKLRSKTPEIPLRIQDLEANYATLCLLLLAHIRAISFTNYPAWSSPKSAAEGAVTSLSAALSLSLQQVTLVGSSCVPQCLVFQSALESLGFDVSMVAVRNVNQLGDLGAYSHSVACVKFNNGQRYICDPGNGTNSATTPLLFETAIVQYDHKGTPFAFKRLTRDGTQYAILTKNEQALWFVPATLPSTEPIDYLMMMAWCNHPTNVWFHNFFFWRSGVSLLNRGLTYLNQQDQKVTVKLEQPEQLQQALETHFDFRISNEEVATFWHRIPDTTDLIPVPKASL